MNLIASPTFVQQAHHPLFAGSNVKVLSPPSHLASAAATVAHASASAASVRYWWFLQYAYSTRILGVVSATSSILTSE